jgi:NADPH-dependent glutamate synthase beta subunit-like oxidoreductase
LPCQASLGAFVLQPCEGACKRKPIDEAVSICLLKRFTADQSAEYPQIIPKPSTGKKVAIIGAGPAGLSAAYYLQIKGIDVTLFDTNQIAGGALQYEIPDAELDKKVLASEAGNIFQSGVAFVPGERIDKQQFDKLRKDFDAVVVATGITIPQWMTGDWRTTGNRFWWIKVLI